MPPKKKSKEESREGELVNDDSNDDKQKEEEEKRNELKKTFGNKDPEKGEDSGGRSKRKRRDSTTYEPEDFTLASVKAAVNDTRVIPGRGAKLADLESVKASIEKCNSEDLPFAYKFLFRTRGKPTKKEMKQILLEFSGYLPPLPNGKKLSDEELEEFDKDYELKFYTKASKLTLNQIKTLFNVFSIDRNDDDEKPLKSKEELVDRLCDFLGNPSELLAKSAVEGTKRKTKNGTAKRKKTGNAEPITKKSSVEEPKDPFALVKDHTKGELPDDDTLRQWVKAYVVCFDMDSATTKHAIKTASDKFGVELAHNKGRIKELLAEEM